MRLLSDPFELFCWYYLGLSPGGVYRFINGIHVAQHYICTVEDLMDYLKQHRIDPDTVLNTDFPLARYQIDVQLAARERGAEDLLQLAGRIFSEFRARLGTARDWIGEIEQERAEEEARRRH